MAVLRRRLRLCVTLWLVSQVASLSALAPRDCCASHQPAEAEHACHENARARLCPMRAADGTPCPMHRDSAQESLPESDRCELRGSCNAPSAALHALLWSPGVLAAAPAAAPDTLVVTVPLAPRERPLGLLLPPESPPPRD